MFDRVEEDGMCPLVQWWTTLSAIHSKMSSFSAAISASRWAKNNCCKREKCSQSAWLDMFHCRAPVHLCTGGCGRESVFGESWVAWWGVRYDLSGQTLIENCLWPYQWHVHHPTTAGHIEKIVCHATSVGYWFARVHMHVHPMPDNGYQILANLWNSFCNSQ